SFENLTGGSQVDVFHVAAGGSVSGTAKGGAEANVLDYTGRSGPVTVNLAALSGTGIAHFAGIATVRAGAGADDTVIGAEKANTWKVAAGGGSVDGFAIEGFENWQGGSLADTLTGPDAVTTWNVTGADSGTVAGIRFSG